MYEKYVILLKRDFAAAQRADHAVCTKENREPSGRFPGFCGAYLSRTDDLYNANVARSQLR